jgi:hypothetical protein
MESGDRSGLLSAGGILSIIVGILEIIGGALITIGISLYGSMCPVISQDGPFIERGFGMWDYEPSTTVLLVVGIIILVLGILALAGGISALRRKSFGLSILGAICAFLPINILGLLSIIFVGLAKDEFENED